MVSTSNITYYENEECAMIDIKVPGDVGVDRKYMRRSRGTGNCFESSEGGGSLMFTGACTRWVTWNCVQAACILY